MYPGSVPVPGTNHMGCLTQSQGLHPWARECHELGAAAAPVQGLHLHPEREEKNKRSSPNASPVSWQGDVHE